MTEKKEKSLDQQIKEAQLAKLKAETADVEKHGKQARVMGVPIVQILFGGIVVGFVLLNYIQPLVDLNKDINTKEKEYDRIEFSLRNKILEARADTLKQLADSLDIEKKQLALLNETLKIEAEDLEKKNKDAEKNLASVRNSISALNDQREELLASIADVTARATIVKEVLLKEFEPKIDNAAMENWLTTYLTTYRMIKAKNYYDKRLNPEGKKGIEHQFQLQPGDSVIFDAATGLTWQQSGSSRVRYPVAEEYVQRINAKTYGGYSDWRLPTLEEAMSLMEPTQKNGYYIAELFDEKQEAIWTSDDFRVSVMWVVDFDVGYCSDSRYDQYGIFIRAVRLGQSR